MSAKCTRFEMLELPYGEPPLSRRRTRKDWESVAASGQPAVPPPTMM